MHFCHEWDTYIHARCVPVFLQTDEGQIVIDHGHEVILDFSLEEPDGNHNQSGDVVAENPNGAS